MTCHPNRSRITILPLDSTLNKWRWRYMVAEIDRHEGWQPEALIEDGCLIRNKMTRRLRIYRDGRILSVDERKAEAALAARHDPA